MTIETYIFKPYPKKITDDNLHALYIAATICFLLILLFVGFPGIGVGVVGVIAALLIREKIQDDVKKGAKRFGSLTQRLILSEDSITIGDTHHELDELQKLEVIAADYVGAPGGMFSSSVGTDNYLDFNFKGESFSYQFQIKSRADLKLVNDLSKEWLTRNGRHQNVSAIPTTEKG